MPDQRLETFMKRTEIQYAEGSPLLLEAIALYLDKATNNHIAQLKWKNIDSRTIRAVKIELIGYDAFDQELGRIQHQYDGIHLAQNQFLGEKTPIIIQIKNVVKFDVALTAVSFEDGTVWLAQGNDVLKALPDAKEQALTGDLLNQLKRDLASLGHKDAASWSSQTEMGLWQCGCGNWQFAGTPCLKCGITQQELSRASDKALLSKHLTEYQEAQEKSRIEAEKKAEEARAAAEVEKARREKQLQEAKEKEIIAQKKKKKIGIILAAVIVLVAGIGYYVTQVLIPGNHYNEGITALNNGDYEKAHSSFKAAGLYQDAETQMHKAAELWGDQVASTGDFIGAYEKYTIDNIITEKADAAAEKAGDQFLLSYDYKSALEWYEKASSSKAADAKARISVSSAHLISDKDSVHGYGVDQMPSGVYTYHIYSNSNGNLHGLFKTGADGWCLPAEFDDIRYYENEKITIAVSKVGGKDRVVIINHQNNHIETIENCKFATVSEEAICFESTEGLYGYADLNGQIIIEPQFTKASNFSDGLASVAKDKLFGYIDLSGELIIDYRFEYAGRFQCDYAVVYINGRVKENGMYVNYDPGYGLINKTGTFVIQPEEWDSISIESYIENGLVKVSKNEKDALLSIDDKTLITPFYDKICEFSEGYAFAFPEGFLNAKGQIIIPTPLAYNVYNDVKFTNGYADVWVESSSGKSYSHVYYHTLVDLTGKIIFEAEPEWLINEVSKDGYFYTFYTKGRDTVYEYYKIENDQVYRISEKAYISKAGSFKPKESTFMKQWDEIGPFNDGIALVSINSHTTKYNIKEIDPPYGYITDQETLLVDPTYENARDYSNGYAAVKLNGLWGFIDTSGNYVIEPMYEIIDDDSRFVVSAHGSTFVKKNAEDKFWRLINMNNEEIMSNISDIEHMADNTIAVKTNSGWILIQDDGQRIF